MGRPPNDIPAVRKTLALPQPLWDAVADYRFSARIPTEAEAVRRLIEAGLAAVKKGKKP